MKFFAKFSITVFIASLIGCSWAGENTETTKTSGIVESKGEPQISEAEMVEAEVAQLAKANREPDEASAKSTKSVKSVKHSSTSKFAVQIGAFKVKENADKLFAQLKQDGIPVEMSTRQTAAGVLYIIKTTATSDKSEANKWVAELKTKSSIDGRIINL